MKNYGLFDSGIKDPMHAYQGDKMSQTNEYVYIYREVATGREMVAAINLGAGQSVKEI